MSKVLKGYLMAIGAFIIWGVLPLYWKAVNSSDSFEVLSHRIVWSCVLLWAVSLLLNRKSLFEAFKKRSTLITLIVSSLLISLNWVVYIFAVNAGFTVQCSLGYYINPLLNVVLGIIFFNEKLDLSGKIAVGLACIGVLYLTVGYGSFPYISFVLAGTFGFYGMLKKRLAMDSLNSLFVETLLVGPLALGYLLFLEMNGNAYFLHDTGLNDFLFLFAGVVTTVPLFLYNEGAKHIPYSTMGFLQYIGPSLMLLIGVFFFGEDFTSSHAISFGFIWSALAIYSGGKIIAARKIKKASLEEVV
ncbi:EamA family transporter RarD [Aureibacter tunicatorum]|uniref:Chloramphenicol-sensitive protein RarD n=1 Tax=Aureibacter tunicatorum TaxID=866807 RepID=A0AAE3XRK6_9BACT|nr:EamA family transporter RarD [Aureibacter tunicatorum]MDR6241847.1 chloramphenicol-sensitive protein RarD [Aureibacter tunicatorum]BDD07094.1 transporter [Aureibacter tunicatorum]